MHEMVSENQNKTDSPARVEAQVGSCIDEKDYDVNYDVNYDVIPSEKEERN